MRGGTLLVRLSTWNCITPTRLCACASVTTGQARRLRHRSEPMDSSAWANALPLSVVSCDSVPLSVEGFSWRRRCLPESE